VHIPDEGLTHVRLEVFIEDGEHELCWVEDVVLVGVARNSEDVIEAVYAGSDSKPQASTPFPCSSLRVL
jgi:hypothetical protein